MIKVVSAIILLAVVSSLASGMYWLSLALIIAIAVILLLALRWEKYPVLNRVGFIRTPLLFLSVVVLAISFRLFFFGIYNIDSNSMNDTLIPGDYVWVNKLSYGPVMPSSSYEIPWIGVAYWLIKGRPSELSYNEWEDKRLKGFGSPSINDVIVFNKPGTDEVFIKRCLATLGDTIQIRQGEITINGRFVEVISSVRRGSPNTPQWKVYPRCDSLGWNVDNWGPFIIPFKGMSVSMHGINTLLYGSFLPTIDRDSSKYSLNEGTIVANNEYVFMNDYYFMVGDNRHSSNDSRFFGPVPDCDIIGKATFILFSKGETKAAKRRSLRSLR